MNKKVMVCVSVGVVVAILLMLDVIRLTPLGQSEGLPRLIVAGAICLLALPMRLYVIFVLGEAGHWYLPTFVIVSGAEWADVGRHRRESGAFVLKKVDTRPKIASVGCRDLTLFVGGVNETFVPEW
jgi:hypothetical protein